MLKCAHKTLLLNLAREHAIQVRQSVQYARATLGEHHANVGRLHERLALAEDVMRTLQSEPAQAQA